MVVNESYYIKEAEKFMLERLKNDSSGHDPDYSYCVRDLAVSIGYKENANIFVVELSALLHDVCDWKFLAEGSDEIFEWLMERRLPGLYSSSIKKIIDEVSFKGAGVATKPSTIEGMVVQDADRLEAMGARGIARCFAYGGFKGRPIYDESIVFVLHSTFEEYKNSKGTAINHFYEKLLLLKDLMNTKTAKELAIGRHSFMIEYLDRFFKERKGEL